MTKINLPSKIVDDVVGTSSVNSWTSKMNFDFKDKKVLIRVDFNVPLDVNLNVTDDTRIRKALPTINHVLDHGGSVILMSHFGRPLKKLNDDGSVNCKKFSLKNITNRLSSLLEKEVQFVSDTVGEEVKMHTANLKPGEVLLLENTRFYNEEKKGDKGFAKQLSELADIYINDAFGTAHRAHASTTTVAHYFQKENKSFGFLMQAEIENAERVLNSPESPFIAILGGAKVSDKIQLIEKLLDLCDDIIIGGGMSYTFSKALGGSIGNSLCEDDFQELALSVLDKAVAKGVNIHLPKDTVIADDFSNDANRKVVDAGSIPDGWQGLDIGHESVDYFKTIVLNARTIIWNGPLGVFEFDNFAGGTNSIAAIVAEATQNGAYSLIGGGDSVSAINKAGLADKVSFVSTGGGAMLEFLEGKELPGIRAIRVDS